MANIKFTNKVLKVIEGLSLSENDVYSNGQHETNSGDGKKASRKYESYGYELGIFSFRRFDL